MLGQTVHLRLGLAALGPFAHHKGSHNYSPGIGEAGESASSERWIHIAEQGGGAEVSALGVARKTTVALPMLDTLLCYCRQ